MSSLSNLNLAAIDGALIELEPTLEQFGRAHGFTLVRSHNGSLNVPRRWLHRHLAAVFHEIGLIIALPMPERLERGFYPDIPCTLYIAAADRKTRWFYHTSICEALPFSQLGQSLAQHLADAGSRLETCTPDFIVGHGAPEPLA